MKRADLIRKLEEAGCELVRHGGKHDWYRNPKTGVSQPVPRHREINESLCEAHLEEDGSMNLKRRFETEVGRSEPPGQPVSASVTQRTTYAAVASLEIW